MTADMINGYYNLTSLINSSSIGNLMSNISPVLGGYYLGVAYLLIIWAVTFLYLKGLGRWQTSSCVLSADSLTLVVSWFLFTMSIISATVMWWVVFLWLGTFLYIALTEGL